MQVIVMNTNVLYEKPMLHKQENGWSKIWIQCFGYYKMTNHFLKLCRSHFNFKYSSLYLNSCHTLWKTTSPSFHFFSSYIIITILLLLLSNKSKYPCLVFSSSRRHTARFSNFLTLFFFRIMNLWTSLKLDSFFIGKIY